MLRKSIIAVVFCFVFLLSLPLFAEASPLAYITERIAGQDRIETAIGIAQKGWDTTETVILCELNDYPGSIAAAPYAASLDAPILLTGGQKLDSRVVDELERLQPQKAILIGGEALLATAIVEKLENLGIETERIGGANRYATSVLLAERLYSDSLIIANGDDFPDALSAASYAGIAQIPIVLTSKKLPAEVLEYCQQIQPENIIVIGGEAVVPTESLSEHDLIITTRLGGENRYATNAKVVEHMQNVVESNDLFLASGVNFPDAIAGTVLAAKEKAPLLLTAIEDIPPDVYSLMRLHMKVEPPVATTSSGQGKVTASGGLNLRDTPSISGKLLLTIPQGASIDILGTQGQWYKTSYQNKNGWVSAAYVEVTQKYTQGKITANGGLNLRESASTSAEIIQTIPEGATITILTEGDEWHKVNYRGEIGWVFAEYVRILPSNGSVSGEIDLSPNGQVFILGGPSIISANAQNIIEGKATSGYAANLKDFPSLPASLDEPEGPGSYDPTDEVLVDPFAGIPYYALEGMIIVIDPGHGGPDTGAIGPSYTLEKDNNLAISAYLRDILTEAGATVLMTRENDSAVADQYTQRADLEARVAFAKKNQADLFISIHNDYNSNPDISGTSVYYSTKCAKASQSAKLARALQDSIVSTVNTIDKKVRTADFYVIRHATMPAVLIEAAFISNPEEEQRLKNPIFQKNLATAIFHGIYEYVK
ncbi:MAG: SH3 domain-containing protein [Peptococcaceae bacterium]|nr:SH3 domain-containing protein [Peptococcaceae bacterium]